MKSKTVIGMLVLAIVVVASVIVGFQYGGVKLVVLSVDRIWLYQRGIGAAGQELKGGIWRVEATTMSGAELQFLQLNETAMKEKAVNPNDFPSDVDVLGEIYFAVWPGQPYWEIPFKYLGRVEVTPQTFGTYFTDHPSQVTTVFVNSASIDMWTLDLSQKRVHIPFTVQALKTKGDNLGDLQTTDSRASKTTSGLYTFDFSYSQIVSGEMSEVITFFNPRDIQETVKMTLQWVIGDVDKYSWTQNFLFITHPVGPDNPNEPINSMNTFDAADKTAILTQLNWQSGNDWTVCRYWFGGGNVFKGTSEYPNPKTGTVIPFSDGSPSATVHVSGQAYDALLSEGFDEGDYHNTTNCFQYSGWYVPYPNNNEGPSTDVWYDRRYPTAPNVYSDRENLKPSGLSIINYLASKIVAPVTGYTHIAFSRFNPDYWGYGYTGDIPDAYKVMMPTSARAWLFTLDISTEICDTVVVQESYIDVILQNPLSIDKTTLFANDEATITANLHNNSPFSGTTNVGIVPPDSLRGSCSISGGDGSMLFGASESKTVTLRVKNTGLLTADTQGTFLFEVKNAEPRITAQQSFVLMFKAGLTSEPITCVHLIALDADTKKTLSGMLVQVWWGLDLSKYQSGSTVEGLAKVDLDYGYEGPCKIVVTDSQEVYKEWKSSPSLVKGENPIVAEMVKEKPIPPDWTWLILVVLITVAIAVVAVIMTKGKRKRR